MEVQKNSKNNLLSSSINLDLPIISKENFTMLNKKRVPVTKYFCSSNSKTKSLTLFINENETVKYEKPSKRNDLLIKLLADCKKSKDMLNEEEKEINNKTLRKCNNDFLTTACNNKNIIINNNIEKTNPFKEKIKKVGEQINFNVIKRNDNAQIKNAYKQTNIADFFCKC